MRPSPSRRSTSSSRSVRPAGFAGSRRGGGPGRSSRRRRAGRWRHLGRHRRRRRAGRAASRPARASLAVAGVDERQRPLVRRTTAPPSASAASRCRPASSSRYGSATSVDVDGRPPGRRRAGASQTASSPRAHSRPGLGGVVEQRSARRRARSSSRPVSHDRSTSAAAAGQQPDRLAEAPGQAPRLVEVGVGVAAAAQRDEAAHEVRPGPGQRRARAGQHGVGVGEGVVPVAVAAASAGRASRAATRGRSAGRARRSAAG